MSRLLVLSLLLPVLPLLGGLWKSQAAIFSGLLAAVGLALSALISDSHGFRLTALCQIPLSAVVTLTAVTFSRRDRGTRLDGERNSSQQTLGSLKERHAALREAVAKRDEEEGRSLQIYGIAKGLAESLSWKEMAPRLASGLQKLFSAYEFLLYAIDSNGNWTVLQRRGNWAKEPPVPIGQVSETTLLFPPHVRETVPVLTVPIYSGAGGNPQTNGVLFLKSSAQDKTPESLVQTGREFGEQLGVALNKALLFSQMEIHSRFDGLTGVLRRQPFMDRLNEELKRAGVFHTPFSLMMVDIDHFKAVNDTHGHAAGDAVLKRVGELLKESVYETDIVGRYGGEEFVILLPRADAAGVLRKAESLRRRFELEVIPSGFENLHVTVSIGLAHYPEAGQTAEALISKADQALYRAKESGRNRVVAA